MRSGLKLLNVDLLNVNNKACCYLQSVTINVDQRHKRDFNPETLQFELKIMNSI